MLVLCHRIQLVKNQQARERIQIILNSQSHQELFPIKILINLSPQYLVFSFNGLKKILTKNIHQQIKEALAL